ncbi:MAG: hypothetical protein ACI4EV_05475 [Lachnospiraceae bacterium]
MEQSVKFAIFEELDKIVTEKQMENDEVQVAKVIQPLLPQLASKYNVDMVDVFVEYMDHVAIKAKHMAMKEEEMQVDIDAPDFKLY